jgi:nitrite reductase/ring-hydroxylating ferredoxin subunit
MARLTNTGSAYDLPAPSSNDALTRVGRGTPMGELMRRYWHPVYKSDKLHDVPVQVRILGDDVILFRKPNGDAGAVYPRCVHRGSSLFFGKVTEVGIRCGYHGWTFDTDGSCVDQPCGSNRGGSGLGAFRQPWYPVEERYGLIFIYMGPLDRTPAFPRHDALEFIPEGWELYADDTSIPSAGAGYMSCNWLQHHENGLDWAHLSIVHETQFPPLLAEAAKAENSTFHCTAKSDRVEGYAIAKLAGLRLDFRAELILPNIRAIPDPLLQATRPDDKVNNIAWTVPQDDTNTIVFTVLVQPAGVQMYSEDQLRIYNGKLWSELTSEEHQRYPGDFETQVGQGQITFHSEEHLVRSDAGIVMLRRLLKSATETVAQGGNPPLAFGEDDILIETSASVTIAADTDLGPPGDAAHSGQPVHP